MRPYILFLLIALPGLNKADGQTIIKGAVYDSAGSTLPAVIALLRNKSNNQLIKSDVTDSSGRFTLTRPQKVQTILKVGLIGYYDKEILISDTSSSTIDLGNIVLGAKIVPLKTLTVRPDEKIVERKVDKLVFNPSLLLSSEGENVFETLKKAPMVIADENGRITLRGNQSANVMINGRTMHLSEGQLIDYLKSMPSSDIDKIEIITNPSSKYDAQGGGGILNIVLKRNRKAGFNGTSTTFYEQANRKRFGQNINLSLGTRKLSMTAGVNLKSGNYATTENIDNIFRRNLDPYYYFEEGKRDRTTLNLLSKFGVDYYFTKSQTLSLRIDHNYISRKGKEININRFGPDQVSFDSLYNTLIAYRNHNNIVSGNISYTIALDTMGQSLSADADYISYLQPNLETENRTDRVIFNTQKDYNDIVFLNQGSQKTDIYSGKVDYANPLGSIITLELGSKIYTLSTNYKVTFQDPVGTPGISQINEFKYGESNFALYINLLCKISTAFSLQAGVRNENTSINGSPTDGQGFETSYSNFFPSCFIQYVKNQNHQLGLSFTQRINRPDYSSLNPARYYSNPNSYTVGNPFLSPSITHSVDFSYTLKQKYYISLFGNHTSGQITQVPILNQENYSYQFASINLDKSYNYGISSFAPLTISDWWSATLSLLLNLNGVNSEINEEHYVYNSMLYQFQTNSQFTVSERRNLFAELNFLYQPAGAPQGLFVLGRLMDLSVSFKKNFGKNASCVLSFNDILNSAYVTAAVDRSNQHTFIYGQYNRRSVKLAYTYKFGKPVKPVKNKKPSAEDEKLRIK